MQILSTPPPQKKKSTLSVNALTTFMYVHNFFHKVWLYSLEGCIHEHCICLCLLPLSYLPHNEPDYRHILRSICRIVATISVRRDLMPTEAQRTPIAGWWRTAPIDRVLLTKCQTQNWYRQAKCQHQKSHHYRKLYKQLLDWLKCIRWQQTFTI